MTAEQLAQGQLHAAWVSAAAAIVQAVGAVAAIIASIVLARGSAARERQAEASAAERERRADEAADRRAKEAREAALQQIEAADAAARRREGEALDAETQRDERARAAAWNEQVNAGATLLRRALILLREELAGWRRLAGAGDRCRALICDDETNQEVTGEAFDLARTLVETRLKLRRLAVVDATNVRAADRKGWIEAARKWHALPVAIVIEPGAEVCAERNRARPDRPFGAGVVQRMTMEIRKGLGGLQREGFRQVWKLTSAEAVEAAVVSRQPLWTDKRHDAGPFDIIGDVHGCADELQALLAKLGYHVEWLGDHGERRAAVTAPPGRKAASSATSSTAVRTPPTCFASSWAWSRRARPTPCRATMSASWNAGSAAGR